MIIIKFKKDDVLLPGSYYFMRGHSAKTGSNLIPTIL